MCLEKPARLKFGYLFLLLWMAILSISGISAPLSQEISFLRERAMQSAGQDRLTALDFAKALFEGKADSGMALTRKDYRNYSVPAALIAMNPDFLTTSHNRVVLNFLNVDSHFVQICYFGRTRDFLKELQRIPKFMRRRSYRLTPGVWMVVNEINLQ